MEMRKTVLYGVLAFCLVVLNSCLGDPATQLTMANQAGVVVTGYDYLVVSLQVLQ